LASYNYDSGRAEHKPIDMAGRQSTTISMCSFHHFRPGHMGTAEAQQWNTSPNGTSYAPVWVPNGGLRYCSRTAARGMREEEVIGGPG
jgi:hypothetical protein